MVTTLVPTVHERIARCNASVYLERLVPGAQVVLAVDGTEYSAVADAGTMPFPVPVLAGGELIRAMQDAGFGFTPWSPEVEVEDVALPPVVSPHLPSVVGACSECVHVTGLVPGSAVELFLASTGDIVGTSSADRVGAACVRVDLTQLGGEGFGFLGARMIVCGQTSPESSSPLVTEGELGKPEVVGPLFGCQRMVPTRHLQPGARVRYEMDAANLGSICSCWEAANVWIGTDLVAGRRVRAVPYRESGKCKSEGPPSEWVEVVPPDARIKPVIQPALIDGDRTLRVLNQFANATVTIRIRADAEGPFDEFGPAATSQWPEFDLNAPLVAGNVVTVVQTLCSVSVESDPVVVLPRPPVVLPPVIIPPLYQCATGVQVSNLHQGAFLRLYADGIPIGTGFAGTDSSIAISARLAARMRITATQRVGGITSAHSEPAVEVTHGRLEEPRIIAPVARGDRTVQVTHVTPGAHLEVWSGLNLLGGTDATETVVSVPVSSVDGTIHAKVQLCGQESVGRTVEVISPPSDTGPFGDPAEDFRKYADFTVPAGTDGDKFDMPMEGQLYFPSNDGKSWPPGAHNLPLVVIAHGYWAPLADSYLGYNYLARHLASWGMVVYSLNLDEVNNRTQNAAVHQYSRGEIILKAIDELGADPELGGRLDLDRIGLVGHSMGGEGVVLAQHLNESGARGVGIIGVVSIAPTNHRPEVVLRRAKYLQVLGSMDLLSQSLNVMVRFNGFRLYDRAWYPKTHAWIYGVRHNPFNRQWVQNGDTYEAGLASLALSPAQHEEIARCLINAFFQDVLFHRTAYSGYMQGTILPESLRHLHIYLHHRQEPRKVIDNFGDVDEQEAIGAQPLDKLTNSLALPATASGTGLVSWLDVDHTTSAAISPHQVKSTDVSWNPPSVADVVYSTEAGGATVRHDDVISISVGQYFEDSSVNPEGLAADLFVALDDGSEQALVRAGSIAPIPYPDMQEYAARLCPMRTIRIPADAFTAANRALDLGRIAKISLYFTARPTGRIFVDNIEIAS